MNESRYSRKAGNQMYGNGNGAGANRRTTVRVHNGPITLNIKGKEKTFKSIAKVPSKFLPIFTDTRTARPHT